MVMEMDLDYIRILESIKEGIIIVNNECRVIVINKAAVKLLDTTSAAILNKHFDKNILIEEQKGFYISLSSYLKKILVQKPKKIETVIYIAHKKNITYRAPVTITRDIFNKMGNVALLIIPDFTKEQEIEHIKNEFLALISHQLRSPLGSMRWGLEMLMAEDGGKLPAEASKMLQQVYDSNQWMITLVNDILNVSRIEKGKIDDIPEQIDYVSIIRRVLKEEELIAKKNFISTTLDIRNPTTHIRFDPRSFREVIQNLITNAVKYSYPHGNVVIIVEQLDKLVKISIKDHGMGIPDKDKPMIFSKFFRARNAMHSQTDGTGLGLYVVKSYVAGWGAGIWFETKEKEGTTFHLEIPIHKENKVIS